MMNTHADIKDTYAFTNNSTKMEISCSDIVFFESCGHYIVVHMRDKTMYKMRKTLRTIETELGNKGFIRVHRGFMVNLSYVKKIGRTSVFLESE